jgi:Fe-S oxidoreductase
MFQGDPIGAGWRDEHVRDALDLCLACKGCKGECPNNVDMATYKAEFLSHYYEGRLRPRHAYSMGLIDRWARLAAVAPRVANFVGQTPGLSAAAKWLGGIAPQRRMPAFATETFKEWFFRRRPGSPAGRPVVLWADTFTNFFRPEHGKAAVAVLEDAGCQVLVPRPHLCCGRPLYDFGMLDTAKAYLRRVLTTLQPVIEAGIPVVGLEPSCTAVFRDELGELFAGNEDAKRLGDQTFYLSEFLTRHAPGWTPPRVGGAALVHVHCHHKSVIGAEDELELLARMGVEVREPEPGCCGLAGSFGFEAGHYGVSMAIGEQRLLPAVRRVGDDELVIGNGFSCQTQFAQGAGRQPKHLAQVIASALPHRPEPPADGRRRAANVLTGVLVAGGAALAATLLVRAMRRQARPVIAGAGGSRVATPGPASGRAGGGR